MGVNNKAAWLTKAQAELEVKEGPEPKLEKDDVLIENKAVAINPGKVTCMSFSIEGTASCRGKSRRVKQWQC